MTFCCQKHVKPTWKLAFLSTKLWNFLVVFSGIRDSAHKACCVIKTYNGVFQEK